MKKESERLSQEINSIDSNKLGKFGLSQIKKKSDPYIVCNYILSYMFGLEICASISSNEMKIGGLKQLRSISFLWLHGVNV